MDLNDPSLLTGHGQILVITGGRNAGKTTFCQQVVERTVKELGRLDILVNNAAEQHPQDSITDITREQLERTFRTNIFAMFYLTKAPPRRMLGLASPRRPTRHRAK